MPPKRSAGKVITVRGEVEPKELGRVLMHEHLHSDIYDWDRNQLITEEKPATTERHDYLLRNAVPLLKRCHEFGCHSYVDVTMPPWRAWPSLCVEVAQAADMHIVACTGFYREMEIGKYWVKKPEDRIWPFVISASVEELADYCTREILDGIHGTPVRAGALKLGTSAAEMTDLEKKTFRAASRAQIATGVHITTHCTQIGAETSQLNLFSEEDVDLTRVVIGHTAKHLADPQCRKVCMEWMRRGATFLPTNLGIYDTEPKGERWRPLLEAIHEVFDAGLGHNLAFGLDSGYCSESKAFGPMTFLPREPFLHMFTHTLPAFRAMGLTDAEETMIMQANPQRIIPVQ